MLKSRSIRLLFTLALALSLFALPAIIAAQDVTPTVTVNDQESDGTWVEVPSTTAAVPGWMVIHADNGGSPGPVLGYTEVDAGTTDGVIVNLDPPLDGDTTLWAMLHVDEGEAGVYEFPGADGPARDGESVVMAPFMATMAATTDTAAITETEAMTDTEAMADTAAMTDTAAMADTEAMTYTEAMTDTAAMADTGAVTDTVEVAASEAVTETTEMTAEPTVLPVTGADLGGIAAQLPVVFATLSALAGGAWISRRRRNR